MSDQPTVFCDFEFCFQSGHLVNWTAQKGRDAIAFTGDEVRLQLHPDEQTVQDVLVHRSALAYMATTTRTVAPEETIEDAGRLKLVGTAEAS